jgi:hypothetical protein
VSTERLVRTLVIVVLVYLAVALILAVVGLVLYFS